MSPTSYQLLHPAMYSLVECLIIIHDEYANCKCFLKKNKIFFKKLFRVVKKDAKTGFKPFYKVSA